VIQFLHKILALILAFIVLFTSFSFTIEKHICVVKSSDVSYVTDADFYDMSVEECNLHKSARSKEQTEDCCFDTHNFVPVNQNVQQVVESFELSKVQFIFAYSYAYSHLFEIKEDITSFIDFSPPFVDRDVQVLYQTFII
jgi:hypothetical protein